MSHELSAVFITAFAISHELSAVFIRFCHQLSTVFIAALAFIRLCYQL
jgi:hypothetical protein